MNKPEHGSMMEYCFSENIGYLAYRCCHVKLNPIVMGTDNNYFIGTQDPESGEPISRESVETYSTIEEATTALAETSWTQKLEI